ncbi:MAG: FapA family protein [Gammaproteobacteria bacterium]|nr:FapA family protein [Gammaproteobacteria bacterium]
MEAPAPKPNTNMLRIGLTKDQQYLVALLPDQYEQDAHIDTDWVKRQIARKRFEYLFPLDESIEKLVELYNHHVHSKRLIPIAEKRDAVAEVEVTDDHMSAVVHLTRAYGGKHVTENDIYRMLVERSIIHGINKQTVAKLIAKGEGKNVVVAKGTLPKPGENAMFVSLIPETKSRMPQIREDGMIDFRDLGDIQVVQAGTQLMRRIPATKGEDGKDIFGNVISPRDGIDSFYSNKLYGVQTHTNDANLLIALDTGQPIQVEDGVVVEKIITYDKIDMSIGNVVFDGSVVVNGDVAPGMKIEVTGDIIVAGIVEAATLVAGGNIQIAQSVIGHGDIYDQQGQLKPDISILTAEGSILANYVENIKLVAGDCIMIREQSIRSELYATNEIIVGSKSAKSGHIIGGHIRSGILVRANTFGSPAGAKTHIEVSADEKIHKNIEQLNRQIEENQSQIFMRTKKLNMQNQDLASFNPGDYNEARREVRIMEDELDRLKYKKELLRLELRRLVNGRIVIGRQIHPACTIQIGKLKKEFREMATTRTFRIRDGKLTFM